METLVLLIMLLVGLNFVLRVSCHGTAGMVVLAAVAAAAVWLSRDAAIGQSSTQIAAWIASPETMLDAAVVLTLDVALQIAFCMTALQGAGAKRRWYVLALRWVPSLLWVPVLFAGLVTLIYAVPGADFSTITAAAAAAVLIAVPLMGAGAKWLLPEKELRLETIFLVALLTAGLGVIATVNGRTAVAGVSEVDWRALAGVCLIGLAGAMTGFAIYKIKNNRTK